MSEGNWKGGGGRRVLWSGTMDASCPPSITPVSIVQEELIKWDTELLARKTHCWVVGHCSLSRS